MMFVDVKKVANPVPFVMSMQCPPSLAPAAAVLGWERWQHEVCNVKTAANSVQFVMSIHFPPAVEAQLPAAASRGAKQIVGGATEPRNICEVKILA